MATQTSGILRAFPCFPLLLTAATAAQQRPDLSMLYVSVPGAAAAGQYVSVNYDVKNVGNLVTGAQWYDAIWFNSSRSKAGAARLASIRRDGQLFPGWTYGGFPQPWNTPISVRIPVGAVAGTYYVGYEANYSNTWPIDETNFGNNVSWGTVRVDSKPDLTISRLVVTTPCITPGGPMDVSLDLRNLGGSLNNASARVDLFLSASQSPSGNPIHRTDAVVVAASTAQLFAPRIIVPGMSVGRYYLIAVADRDNAVLEADENNNVTAIPLLISPAAAVSTFGRACAGSVGSPTIVAVGLPSLGNSAFAVDAGNLPAPTFTTLVLGFSKQAWNGLALPLDLQGLGAVGCALLVAPEVQVTQFLPMSTVRFPLPIPATQAVLGTHVYAQGFVYDRAANALNFVSTAALDLLVGC